MLEISDEKYEDMTKVIAQDHEAKSENTEEIEINYQKYADSPCFQDDTYMKQTPHSRSTRQTKII